MFVSPRSGAETDQPADATAYSHRDPVHHVPVEARWEDSERDDEHVDWVREFHEALSQYTTGAAAVNFLTDDRVRAAYGDNYDRLAAVKAQWDPDDVFGAPQTVPPDGG